MGYLTEKCGEMSRKNASEGIEEAESFPLSTHDPGIAL